MIISKENAPFHTWGEDCTAWHLLQREGMSIFHEQMPPGTQEVMHYHVVARQFFFILKGTAVMCIQDRREIVQAGQGIEIEPGTPHQIINETGEAIEFLVISQPPTQGDRTPVTPS